MTYDTINIIGGNVMAVITIRNVDENVNNALISMAKKRGLSRDELLRRHLEGLTLSGEVKEVEERYNSLILTLLGKLPKPQALPGLIPCMKSVFFYALFHTFNLAKNKKC